MLLEAVRKNPELPDDAIVAKCCRENANIAGFEDVWENADISAHI